MSTTAKLALSAAAVLLAAMTWMLLGSRGAASPTPATAPGAPPVPAVAAAEADAAAPAPAAAGEPAEPRAATERELVVAPPALHGRCLDDSDRPLAGLTVELRRHRDALTGEFEPAPGYPAWLAAHPGTDWHDLHTTTGADGTFAFAAPLPPLRFALHVGRDGLDHFDYLGQLLDRPRELGDLVLPSTCTVAGRVLDGIGAAVGATDVFVRNRRAGSSVVGETLDGPLLRRTVLPFLITNTLTAADGRFALRLLPGDYEITVRYRDIMEGESLLVAEHTPAVEHAITVVAVGPEDSVRGMVVDMRGHSVAGAEVHLSGGRYSTVTSDADGRFLLLRQGSRGETVSVYALLGNRVADSRPCRWGEQDLRLVLPDADTFALELRVTGPDGAALTDYRVRGFGTFADYPWSRVDGHHDDGTLHLADVPRGLRCLLVFSDRDDLGDSGYLLLPQRHPDPLHLDVRLPAAGDRLLRVLHADGKAAAGIAVELLDGRPRVPDLEAPALSRARMRQPEIAQNPGHELLLLQAGRTDGNGELRLHGPLDVPVWVRLPGPGNPPLLVECPLAVPEPLVVTLPDCGRVEGRVEPPAAVQQLRAACNVRAKGSAEASASSKDRGIRLRRAQPGGVEYLPGLQGGGAVPSGDGDFAIAGVPPGTWDVVVSDWDQTSWPEKPDDATAVASVRVRAGETSTIVLQLQDRLLGTLEAKVLANGAPFANQNVTLIYGSRGRLAGRLLSTDAEGSFRVQARPGAVFLCTLADNGSAVPRDRLWARDAVQLQPGEPTTALLHLDSGKLRLRLLDAGGNAAAGAWLILRGADGVLHTPSPSDDAGLVEVEAEPGTFAVLAVPRALGRTRGRSMAVRAQHAQALEDPLHINLLAAGEVTVRRGETGEAQLQLPAAWSR